MLVPPLSRCKVEDSAHDAQGKIDALGPPACSPPCFDKRLQAALMHPVQRQIADERVEVFQVQRVAVDRCLMPMLKQILRGGLTKTSARPHPIDGGLPDLLKPEGEIALCFREVTCSSAFAKRAVSADLLVDMPDVATLMQPCAPGTPHDLPPFSNVPGRPLRRLHSSAQASMSALSKPT